MAKGQNAVGPALIGLMGAFMAVVSLISIPMPAYPITLQIFAAALCGFLLGPRRGAAAVAVYLVLGCIGLPVFSAGSAGFGHLLSPTGGFLWSFPALACLCGINSTGFLRLFWPALGLALNYAVGLLQFAVVNEIPVATVWLMPGLQLVPALIKDILLVAVAGMAAKRIKRVIPRHNLLTNPDMCDNVNSNSQE